MHQRGWYKTMPANRQEIQQFSNNINTMYNDIMQTAHNLRSQYGTEYSSWQSNYQKIITSGSKVIKEKPF